MVNRKLVYSAILIVPLLGGVAARLLRVIIAFTLRDAGLSVFEITLVSSSFMLSRALFSPVLGKIADKGFRRYILVALGFAGLLIDATLYLVVHYPGIFILRILDGLFSAMVWPTMQAIVHFSTPKGLKARVMSLYFIMGSIGMSVGYLLYSTLRGNFLYAIYLIALVYIIEIAFSFSFRDVRGERNPPLREKIKLDSLLYILVFLFGMFMSLGNEVLLLYLAEELSLGKVLATLVLSAGSLISLLGSILIGHMADKRGFTRAILLLSSLSILSAFMIAFNNVYVAVFGSIIFFISGRGFMPISRSFTASASNKIGTSLGFVNLSSNLGSVIGPLLGGAIMDAYHNSHVLGFNLSALSFILIALWIPVVNGAMVRRAKFI